MRRTMCATGRRTLWPGGAKRRDCPTTSSIHAPPRFSAPHPAHPSQHPPASLSLRQPTPPQHLPASHALRQPPSTPPSTPQRPQSTAHLRPSAAPQRCRTYLLRYAGSPRFNAHLMRYASGTVYHSMFQLQPTRCAATSAQCPRSALPQSPLSQRDRKDPHAPLHTCMSPLTHT